MLYVRVEESRCYPDVPKPGPRFECCQIFQPDNGVAEVPEERRVRGVMKRSQHSCHVAHRSFLDAPFGEWPGRLSLKIDDYVVLPGVQNLTQVEITVDARPFSCDLPREHCSKVVQYFALKVQNPQRLVEQNAPKRVQISSQDKKHPTRMISHRLVQRSLIQERKRFRRKIGIVVI